MARLLSFCRRGRASSPADARGQEPGASAGSAEAPGGHSPDSQDGECPFRPTLTLQERDALYYQGLDLTADTKEIRSAIASEEVERAEQLACRFTETRRLLDALANAREDRGEIEIDLPPEELRRILLRMRDRARDQLFRGEEEGDPSEAEAKLAERAPLVFLACDRLIGECERALGPAACMPAPRQDGEPQ